MNNRTVKIVACITLLILGTTATHTCGQNNKKEKRPAPLKVLLVTGGCCHDYPNQIEILRQGLSQRAHIQLEVFLGSPGRAQKLPIHQTEDWCEGYDLIIHNECYGGVTDVEYVERMVRGHTKHQVPMIAIHCAMHSYRNAKTDAWRELLGVKSMRHQQHVPVDVINRDKDNPIMAGFPDQWTTPNGELYEIVQSWPNCKFLATAFGVRTKKDHVVFWTNEYEGVRVFGTTLGHHNETMMSNEYMDTMARGLLWACGKLDEAGNAMEGYQGTGVAEIQLPYTVPKNAKTPTPLNKKQKDNKKK